MHFARDTPYYQGLHDCVKEHIKICPYIMQLHFGEAKSGCTDVARTPTRTQVRTHTEPNRVTAISSLLNKTTIFKYAYLHDMETKH